LTGRPFYRSKVSSSETSKTEKVPVGVNMSRLFHQPRRIVVRTNALGEPVTICRGSIREHIVSVGKRWRVKENWWRQEISREYFQIETASGLVGEIYCDTLSGLWYLQRIYD